MGASTRLHLIRKRELPHLILHTAVLLLGMGEATMKNGCTLCVIALRGVSASPLLARALGASLSKRAHIMRSLGCIHQLNALFHKCSRDVQWSILDSAKRVCIVHGHQHPSHMCARSLTISSLHFKLFALNLTAAAARTSI